MFKFLKKNKGLENAPSEVEMLEHVNEACSHRPVATFDVMCKSETDLRITVERRGPVTSTAYAWMVTKSDQPEVPVGCQVALVNGVTIPDSSSAFFALDCFLGWPNWLTFVLPPYKKGAVLKKSKVGWEKWNDRILEVRGGRLRYWDASEPGRRKGHFEMHNAKMSWANTKDRPYCLALSFADELIVVSLSSELERFEWAVALTAAIQMDTSGLAPSHQDQVRVSADSASQRTTHGGAALLGDRFKSEIPF